LLNPKETPGVPRRVRMRAGCVLRHFPMLADNGEPMFSRDEFPCPSLRKEPEE